MGLHIGRIYYPVMTLGPGKRVGIWITGCNKRCENCISPEFQKKENGREMTIDEILYLIKRIPETPDGFTISGGEPFLDPGSLSVLLEKLYDLNDDIILFTGYTYKELIARKNRDVEKAMSYCSLIIDGPYIDYLNDGKGLRGSVNQNFIINRYRERYSKIENGIREIQNVIYGESVLSIGIPKGVVND